MSTDKSENDRTESVECLAAELVKNLSLPDSLLSVAREAIEKKAGADGITLAAAQKAILIRAICWLAAYRWHPGRSIDAKWFQTARYNAWPRPNRYGQHNRVPVQRQPRRRTR